MKPRMSVISLILCVTAFSIAATRSPDQNNESNYQSTLASKSPPAQKSAHQEDVVKIGVTLVQVDAIVTDKQGRQVTDLSADDFEIFEDGKRQSITNFSYFATESAEAPTVTPPKSAVKDAPSARFVPLKPTQVRRSIAIVVDDAMTFASIDATRDALRKFVDDQMQPGDLVSIVRTAGGMGALQRFTADKQVLHAAINHIRWIARDVTDMFEPITPTSDALASITRKRSDDKAEDYALKSGPVQESRDTLARLVDQPIELPLFQSLTSVTRGLQQLPGRKSVMLFSPGFDMWKIGAIKRTQLQLLIERLNRAAISIYPIDPRGLVVTMITAQEDMQASDFLRHDAEVSARSRQIFVEQGGLAHMAHETGGLTFFNRNDLSAGVR